MSNRDSDFEKNEDPMAHLDEEEKKNLEKRREKAEKEKAWDAARKIEQEKLFVWRMEGDDVEVVDTKDHGIFFEDAIYIVLKSSNRKARMAYDLHFWYPFKMRKLGKPEPPKKVMELASLYYDNVIFHKEVEYFESTSFKKYFKTFVVLQGGPDKAFDEKNPKKYKPRLLQFKMHRGQGELWERPTSKKALTNRSVFVLDKGLCMLQWNGTRCSEKERSAAGQHIENLLKRRKGKLSREFYDEEDLLPNNPFTKDLNDNDVEPIPHLPRYFDVSMLRLSNENGKLQLTPVHHGRLVKSSIEPSDVNFMDTEEGLFIYIGPKTNKEERNSVWKEAEKYIDASDYNARSIHCIKAGHTSPELEEIWDSLK